MSRPVWIPYLIAALVLLGSALILKPFISAILWSGIMAMATWPMYKRLKCRVSCETGCALLAVSGLFILILIPSLWLIYILSDQVAGVIHALIQLHQQGYPPPIWIQQVPLIGTALLGLWKDVFHDASIPLLSTETLGQAQSMGHVMAQIGRQIATPLYSTLLTLFLLFFWYKDGDAWIKQYKALLKKYHLTAWEAPIASMTITLRSTVNGTILTSLAVGLLLGSAYSFIGIPTAALLGLLSGFLSMIPFALPILLLGLWVYLAITATWLTGLNLFIGGIVLMLISDNIVKPRLIKGHPMPFWMILLGILGGVQALGLIGLFLGPMMMASLALMWERLYKKTA